MGTELRDASEPKAERHCRRLGRQVARLNNARAAEENATFANLPARARFSSKGSSKGKGVKGKVRGGNTGRCD